MEDPPAQQVDMDDEIQDSTVSSNSILSIEAVYMNDESEATEEEHNNNIQLFDNNTSDTTGDHQNINLRAEIQMFQYPDPNIQVRNDIYSNAINLVKVKKNENVVEKSEATSTMSDTFKLTNHNQLMQFITAPLRIDEIMTIDMDAVNNIYEHDRPMPPIIPPPLRVQEIQQDVNRPSTSRQGPSNERNPLETVDQDDSSEGEYGEY